MAAGKDENIALELSEQSKFNKFVEEIDPDDRENRGTIYIGHLPHGFYENELSSYFSQFGIVTKVRLARSKKTGGYKGYGYIQFGNEEVAKIAAEAMNNYLMFDKILKCQFVPESKLHPSVWKGANKRFVWFNRSEHEKRIHNKSRSKEELKKLSKRLIAKDNKKRRKLSAIGIQYEFPGYAAAIKKERKKKILMKKRKAVKTKGKSQ